MTPSLENPATIATRKVVADLIRLLGRKRGEAVAAEMLGVSESWVRKIASGEAERVSQDVADRAAAARGTVLRARLAVARREVAEIEGDLGAEVGLEVADAFFVSALGELR